MCGTANSSFNERCRRAGERLPDGVKFGARLGLAYGTPTLLFCLVINQALPVYVIVCHLAVGVLGGLWLYRRRPDGFPSDGPDEPAAKARRAGPILWVGSLLRACPASGV